MTTSRFLRLALGCALALAPLRLHAQTTEQAGRKTTNSSILRVALIPVDPSRDHDFTKPLITAAFEDAMLKAGRFAALSRTAADAIAAERQYAASGAVDPESAIKIGKALSANYAIIVKQLTFDGSIGSASANIGKLHIPGWNYRTVWDITLQAQAVNVETGEIVQSKSFATKLLGKTTSERPSRPDENSTAGDVYRAALDTFALAFTSELAAAIPLKAVIVLVRDAQNIAINAGAEQGLRVGNRFELIEDGPPIKDPSGAVLGYDDRKIGLAELVRVDAKLSWLKLTQTFDASGQPDSVPNFSKVKQYLTAKMVGTGK